MLSLRITFVALLMAVASRAGPTEDFIMAAMRLSGESSYRWTSMVMDNARAYPVEGRVLADGCTWVRLPIVESIAVRMTPTSSDTVEAVFKGPGRCVVLTPEGWKSLQELPLREADWNDGISRPHIPMRSSGNLLTKEGQRPYSNAQFALNCPHAELAIIVSTCQGLQFEGSEVSGVLSNIGAQLLLVCDGQDQLRPVIAAGRFRAWLQGGRVEKYQIELEGILLVDRQPCLVRQTAMTEIHDVGTTTLDIPEFIRRKLE